MNSRSDQKSLALGPDRTLSRIKSLIESKRGLLNDEALAVYDQMKMLDRNDYRAGLADKLVESLATRLQESWPILYESLTLIRDYEIYKQPEWLAGTLKEPFTDFESYFVRRMGKPFDLFLEMEETYHFAELYHPRWKDKPFSEASDLTRFEKASETQNQIIALSQMNISNAEIAQKVGVSPDWVRKVLDNTNTTEKPNLGFSVVLDLPKKTQNQKASANGISRSQQQKIDKISQHPDLKSAIHDKSMSPSKAYDIAMEREGKPRNHIAPILRQFDKLSKSDKILAAESILTRMGWKRG